MSSPSLSKQVESERAKAHERMLKEALANPGVKEMMDVYTDWQAKDRELHAWREAVRAYGQVVTTNTSQTV